MSKSHGKLDSKETLILGVNDHWYPIARHIAVFIGGLLFFSLIFYFLYQLKTDYHTTASVLIIGLTALLLVLTHWFFLNAIQWSLPNWYITTEQVIEFDTSAYVRNSVRFIKISEIHEIEKHKNGLVQNLFDFGEVVMNVAALPEPLTLKNVSSPSRFAAIIEQIRKNEEFNENAREKIIAIAIKKYRPSEQLLTQPASALSSQPPNSQTAA